VKPEAGLYKRLKENLPNSHITRLESRVGLGIPDCLVALGPQQPRFVMIELKVVKGRKLAISPHQSGFSFEACGHEGADVYSCSVSPAWYCVQ
jgi:hypothetical protein